MECQDASPVHAGYLEKRSRWLHSWRTRWVVLKSNFTIVTYKNNTEQTHTDSIDLKKYYHIKKNHDKPNSKHFQYYSFDLITATNDKYEFRTGNPTDFNAFYEQINRLLISYDPNTEITKHKYQESNSSFLIIAFYHFHKQYTGQLLNVLPNTIINVICLYYSGTKSELWILHENINTVSKQQKLHNHNRISGVSYNGFNVMNDVMDNYVDDKMLEPQSCLGLISNGSEQKYDIQFANFRTNSVENDPGFKWNKIECGKVSHNVILPDAIRKNIDSTANRYNIIPFSHKDYDGNMYGLMFLNMRLLRLTDAFYMRLATNDMMQYMSVKIYNQYSSRLYLINSNQIGSIDLSKKITNKYNKLFSFKQHNALQISTCWLNEYQNKLFIINMLEKDKDIIHSHIDNFTSNCHLFMLDFDEKDANYMKLSNMHYKRKSPGCFYLKEFNKLIVGGNENHSLNSGWTSVVEFYDVFKNEWYKCTQRCKYLYRNGNCQISADQNNPNLIYIFDKKHVEWMDQRINNPWKTVVINGWNVNNKQCLKTAFLC